MPCSGLNAVALGHARIVVDPNMGVWIMVLTVADQVGQTQKRRVIMDVL